MQSDGELANALGRVPVQILIRAKTNQNHLLSRQGSRAARHWVRRAERKCRLVRRSGPDQAAFGAWARMSVR